MRPDHELDPYDDEDARPRRRAPKPQKPQMKRSQREVMAAISEGNIQEARFTTTYRPSRYEAEWLLSSLGMFYEEQLITDVLAQVRGGKEATVYVCQAHPSTGADLLAAKVYRPREFRSLRNDAIYREGRSLLTVQGRAMLGERGHQAQRPDRRMMRAVAAKSGFGQAVMHTSWLSYEFTFMEQLFNAGAAVPRPFACADNAILMSYYGELGSPAPALNSVQLDPGEAEPLLDDTLRAIELMLQHGYVHGDLSAYNILYWEGALAIIDFPQVTSLLSNPNAYPILRRDIERVCDYFARYGARRNAAALTDALWARYALADDSA
jgi:RIO kinase 1